ncbi:hypothetical protein [Herbiconiux sp. YIM B11900]|uniref:hypothetical protein n=1 Tax=Herbiconiux sp. YIM B11900 TaxID=3404131 RepID=UPI003F852173
MEGDNLLTAIVVGGLSGIVGSIIGPIVLRLINRGDRALEARRRWVQDKLQSVFGIGDAPYPTDGPEPGFMRLVPPTAYRKHEFNMHTINPALAESVELMLLQPGRSAIAQRWLENWMWNLLGEYQALNQWWKSSSDDPSLFGLPKGFEKAERRYRRRLRRVQTTASLWAIGQWTRPTIWLWFSSRAWVKSIRQQRVMTLGNRLDRLPPPTKIT